MVLLQFPRLPFLITGISFDTHISDHDGGMATGPKGALGRRCCRSHCSRGWGFDPRRCAVTMAWAGERAERPKGPAHVAPVPASAFLREGTGDVFCFAAPPPRAIVPTRVPCQPCGPWYRTSACEVVGDGLPVCASLRWLPAPHPGDGNGEEAACRRTAHWWQRARAVPNQPRCRVQRTQHAPTPNGPCAPVRPHLP